MVAQLTVADGASLLHFSPLDKGEAHGGLDRLARYFVRASGLAQARLQLAVLSGNRHRALEQIDRLVAIDRQLECVAEGRGLADDLAELEAELEDQRLAVASEKLALVSGVDLPRLEPAFGAGMGSAIAPEEDVAVVEDETIKNRLFHIALWGSGFLLLCAGVTAAVVTQL